eukprot:228176_1
MIAMFVRNAKQLPDLYDHSAIVAYAMESGASWALDIVAQTHNDDDKFEEEDQAEIYVQNLIQNDRSNAIKVLVQKMSAQGKYDPYLMEFNGGNNAINAWVLSFVGLCVRYNSLKVLKDMLQTIDKTKLKRITTRAERYGSPYFGAISAEICQVLLEMGFKVETKSPDLKKK